MHETVTRAQFHKNRKKTGGLGALLEDEVDKRCTRLAATARLFPKNRKKLRGRVRFWKMRSAKGARYCSGSESSVSHTHHHLNHHGNHIIMQVVGKCERSGTGKFKLENTLGRETPLFFWVK